MCSRNAVQMSAERAAQNSTHKEWIERTQMLRVELENTQVGERDHTECDGTVEHELHTII